MEIIVDKHTPGPWEFIIEDSVVSKDRIFSISAGGGCIMCNEKFYVEVPRKEADWHLIVAAPELLAALEDARNVADQEGYSTSMYDAAIAKARGQQ